MSSGALVEEDSSDHEPQDDEKQSRDKDRNRSKNIKPLEGLQIYVVMDDGSIVLLYKSRVYSCDQRESDSTLYLSNFVAIPRDEEGQPGAKVMERVLEMIASEIAARRPSQSATHKFPTGGVHPFMENDNVREEEFSVGSDDSDESDDADEFGDSGNSQGADESDE